MASHFPDSGIYGSSLACSMVLGVPSPAASGEAAGAIGRSGVEFPASHLARSQLTGNMSGILLFRLLLVCAGDMAARLSGDGASTQHRASGLLCFPGVLHIWD